MGGLGSAQVLQRRAQQLFHLVVAANRFTPDEVADIVVAAVPALSQTRQQAAASG